MALDLVPLWAGILALGVFMYVLLDGFDLGVGILFPFAPDGSSRDQMMVGRPDLRRQRDVAGPRRRALLAAFPLGSRSSCRLSIPHPFHAEVH